MSKVWTPPDIKAELAKKGYTLAAIDRLGDGQEPPLYSGAARQALRGLNFRAAVVISQILDVPMHELYPGAYLTARANRPGTGPSALTDPSHKTTSESRQSRSPAVDSARAA